MNPRPRTAYWTSAMALLTFFLTWSFAYSLFPLWLNQTLQLSGKQTGIVFAANALAALFAMPVYGVVQDRLGTGKQLLRILALLTIAVGPFFVYVYQPLLTHHFFTGVCVGALYSALAFGAAVGTLEALIERIGRQHGVEFGKARLWGSLGWAVATFAAGIIFNISPQVNFWIASISGVAFFVCVLRLPTENITAKTPYTNNITALDVFALLKLTSFWRLGFYVMGVSCLYQIYDQQFAIYFASMFPNVEEGNRFYGYLNSVQVFIEAGLMFIAPSVVNKIGAKKGLLLSGAIMALRIMASGMVDDAISISLVKLLHAVELPLLLVSIFKYISANFDSRLSATIYLIGFNVVSQAVTTALSSVVGEMYDTLGFANAYLVLGTVVTINVVISWLVLEGNGKIKYISQIK
ncbi:oligosaccharide MFS transporter [Paraglaciecola mesophila]|uniref:Oligosaccharide MFS transporter n=1 Tax=Paraglaciecola mesophila TaxID=197222 RepID=A0ABU9SXN6_9ALTE